MKTAELARADAVAPAPRKGSPLRSLGEINRIVKNPKSGSRFLIPNVLPIGPGFLYGASGSGKTGIAINVAIAVANGLPWAGIPPDPSVVFYLAAEDQDGVYERLVAAAEAAGLDPDLVPIHVMSIETIPTAVELKRDADKLSELHSLPVGLVVIDTFAAAYGDQSQDDANHASAVMRKLDRIATVLRCSVLALHHTGKGLPNVRSGMRGSQVFFDRANAVLRVDRRPGTVTVEKLKNAPEGACFSYEISGRDVQTARGAINVQVVADIHSLIADDRAVIEQRMERSARNQADIALARLMDIAVDGAARMKEWRDACLKAWADKSEASQRKAFSRARDELQRDGKIIVDGQNVTVTSLNVTCPADVTTQSKTERDIVTVTPPLSRRGVSRHRSHAPRQEEKGDE